MRLEIEIRGVEFLQFEREQFLVPIRPGDGAIHHQAKCLHLRRRPLVAEDHGHFGDAQLARGFQTEVAVHDFAVAAGEHGNLEAELADAAAHAIDRGVVLSRVACVEDQLVDGPGLDFSLRLRDHFIDSIAGQISPAPKSTSRDFHSSTETIKNARKSLCFGVCSGGEASEQAHGVFLPPRARLVQFRFGMEPARRFAPRTWSLRSLAASGRPRARVSITRCLPAAGSHTRYRASAPLGTNQAGGWLA